MTRRDQVGSAVEDADAWICEFGADHVPDLMTVVMDGDVSRTGSWS